MKRSIWLRARKRKRAMTLVMKGKTVAVVAEKCGVTRQSVCRWWREYVHGGEEALVEQKRGAKKRVVEA